jgi:hypothetical protein
MPDFDVQTSDASFPGCEFREGSLAAKGSAAKRRTLSPITGKMETSSLAAQCIR